MTTITISRLEQEIKEYREQIGLLQIKIKTAEEIKSELLKVEKSEALKELDKQIAKYESFKLTLTPREKEILNLIAEGYLNKQIAQYLHLAESTIKNHIAHIFEKLGVSNRTEAAIKALEFRSYLKI